MAMSLYVNMCSLVCVFVHACVYVFVSVYVRVCRMCEHMCDTVSVLVHEGLCICMYTCLCECVIGSLPTSPLLSILSII